jgi:hypothetical protein
MDKDYRMRCSNDWDAEEDSGFEKIKKSQKPLLPTAADRRARRSSKETFASRKVRKSVSSKGGMHRRRQRKID